MSKGLLNKLAEDLGGKIDMIAELPDGSGFATMSWPLPKDHWIYTPGDTEPPAPLRMGEGELRSVLATRIRESAKYAIRASTDNGREMDFDPDAMVQNLIVALLGYWTKDGFSRES